MNIMRAIHIAALAMPIVLGGLTQAAAQSPRDLANLAWGAAAPAAYSSRAPHFQQAVSGGSAHDLALLSWRGGVPAAKSRSANAAIVATGGTGADLARLSGAPHDEKAAAESNGLLAAQAGRPRG
jgi:hypothetical protein